MIFFAKMLAVTFRFWNWRDFFIALVKEDCYGLHDLKESCCCWDNADLSHGNFFESDNGQYFFKTWKIEGRVTLFFFAWRSSQWREWRSLSDARDEVVTDLRQLLVLPRFLFDGSLQSGDLHLCLAHHRLQFGNLGPARPLERSQLLVGPENYNRRDEMRSRRDHIKESTRIL